MRRIINSTYITVDGVIQNPQDWPSSGDDGGEGQKIQTDLLLSCDTLLMGKATYESFASVWQRRSGDPLTDHMNAMTKYVVSSTLGTATWNNTTVIRDDPVAEIRRLKEQTGGNIIVYGVGQMTHALIANGLLDELRLWFHPFLLGRGSAQDLLFKEGMAARLELANTVTLKNGIIIVTYRILQ